MTSSLNPNITGNTTNLQTTNVGTQNDTNQVGNDVGGKKTKWTVGKVLAFPFVQIGKACKACWKAVFSSAPKAPPQQTLTVEHSKLTKQEKTYLMDQARQGDYYNSLDQAGKKDFEGTAKILMGRPEAVKAMTANGVTMEEAVCLHRYTTQEFYTINNEIRDHLQNGTQLSEETSQLKDKFESGLAKLPSISEDVTLKRGAKLPTHVANQHKAGQNITTTGLYSTTMDPNQEFRDINTSITITPGPNSKGADISMFSNIPEEAEVAFPTGTQFHVDSRQIDGPQGLMDYDKDVAYDSSTNSMFHIRVNLQLSEV